jgi:hypothetical protein
MIIPWSRVEDNGVELQGGFISVEQGVVRIIVDDDHYNGTVKPEDVAKLREALDVTRAVKSAEVAEDEATYSVWWCPKCLSTRPTARLYFGRAIIKCSVCTSRCLPFTGEANSQSALGIVQGGT